MGDLLQWAILYWQPLTGVVIGVALYLFVLYRRGLHRDAINGWDSKMLCVGGILIVLGLFYVLPIQERYPAAWMFGETKLNLSDSAADLRFISEKGFFGDGDQILYYRTTAEDVSNILSTTPRDGFTDWVTGPFGESEMLPRLAHGTPISDAPAFENSSDVMRSHKAYGPEQYPEANYIDIFVNTKTNEIIVHKSDS